MRSAYQLYLVCCLLDPPDELPSGDKAKSDALFFEGEFLSPWAAVLALRGIDAFGD